MQKQGMAIPAQHQENRERSSACRPIGDERGAHPRKTERRGIHDTSPVIPDKQGLPRRRSRFLF